MKIQVTQDHIDRGRQFESASCPIALACQEATGRCVEVTRYYIYLLKDKYIIRRPLGKDKNSPEFQFALKFDKGEKVQPFEFDLDLL